MFLLSLEYPANVLQFFGGLFPLVTFDMLSMEVVFEFFGVEYDNVEMVALSNQFETMGYDTTFIVLNLGSLCLVILIQPIVIVVLALVRRIPFLSSCKRLNTKIDN